MDNIQEMEEVNINQKSEIYDEIGSQSPNQLYKKYVNWIKVKYGQDKKPLAFKEWLTWAQEKGMVENYMIEGEEGRKTNEAEKIETVKNTGKRIAFALVVIASIMLIINFTRTKNV